ncbi:hypothetical protein BDN72DRAFT_963443 [Pluteus cervinus]|uniref:Uncharacterized protein n=1 Tax=Pluteus cervinus TaxID=181527 RepID=A0ACD3AF91_9AGAR|nr:hypothetical protein BDN72DRAFT_963443 [Pluteus cervinus]
MKGGSSQGNVDADGSSPTSDRRSPAVKVTYLGRQKKKRQLSDTFLMVPPSDADSVSAPQSQVSKEPNGVKNKGVGSNDGQEGNDPDTKAEPKVPPKIDFKLPGPSPKRDTGDGDRAKRSPTATRSEKKTIHSRSASMASLTRGNSSRGSIASPSSAQKPVSPRSHRSMDPPKLTLRKSTPRTYAEVDDDDEEDEEDDEEDDEEEEEDDGASVVDSISSNKIIRRTEAERKQYFQNEPDVGRLEDHRAHCKRCKHWVNLGKTRKYMVRPWEIHRGKCDQLPRRASSDAVMSPGANTAADESDDAASTTILSKPTFSKRKGPTAESARKAILESDEYVEDFEPDEAKCRKCGKWIVLSKKTTYTLNNWYRHRKGCIEGLTTNPVKKTQSDRVASAKRKMKIVNDARAKSFGIRHVACGKCGMNVILEGEGDYNLTSWEAHKAQCSPSNQATPAPGVLDPVAGTSQANSISFPSGATRAPPSVSSTDGGTAIASEISSPSGSGLKRPRVEGDSELPRDDPDARPQIRPRTETYEPPKKEAPSSLGWFLLPFKAFVRGFRESLKGGDPSPST